MSKEKELKSIMDGEYIFTETINENQFLFYRQDYQKLGEVGEIPMKMYEKYMKERISEGELPVTVMKEIKATSISNAGKFLKLTTYGIGEKNQSEQKSDTDVKKLIRSLFDKKKGQ